MTKEKLEDYIKNNYNKLLSAAKWITKDDTAGDLLNDVLYYLLTREEYSEKLKNCTNFYNYINRAMVLQYYSPEHQYNKNYKRYIQMFDEQEQIDNEYDMTYEDIISFISQSRLFKTKIKTFECKTLFIDYFAPETTVLISGMTLNEVIEVRKTSYMKIAKKYGISKTSVRNAIQETIQKIKTKYDR